MRELGWRRILGPISILLCRLLTAVRDAMPDVEMIHKESHVGDHAGNGEAENAVKEVKRPIRVLQNMFRRIIQVSRGCRDTVRTAERDLASEKTARRQSR